MFIKNIQFNKAQEKQRYSKNYPKGFEQNITQILSCLPNSSGPISLQIAFQMIPQKSSSPTIIVQKQFIDQYSQQQPSLIYDTTKNQSKKSQLFEPIAYTTSNQMKSKSSIQVSVKNSNVESILQQPIPDQKQGVQFQNQNLNLQQPNQHTYGHMKKSLSNQGKKNEFFSHREHSNHGFTQTQEKSITNSQVVGEKEYKTTRPLITQDEKKKCLSQHQNQSISSCTQNNNCNCTTCQIKVLYNRLIKMNSHNKQENHFQNPFFTQVKNNSQLLQSQQETQQTLQHYSTQQNSELLNENLLQNQVNQFNSLNRLQNSYNHQQQLINEKQQLSQHNQIVPVEIQENQILRQTNELNHSRLSLSESILFSSRQNNDDQSIGQQNKQIQNQQKLYQQNQSNNNREEILSRMYEQNTQLQQLIQDQQTYIQLLYNQMIQYQGLLDINKIPYTTLNTTPQFSESNFSILGSTAAASPVISQFCHSARTSDLGYSETIDSPQQEQNFQSNLVNQYQKYCQQKLQENQNQIQGQYTNSPLPIYQTLNQQNQFIQIPSNTLQNSSLINNNSNPNLDKQFQNDFCKLQARSNQNEINSGLSPQQSYFIQEQKNQFLIEKGIRQGQNRSKSIYNNSNTQLNSVIEKESLQESQLSIKTPNPNQKSVSLTNRDNNNIKNIYSHLYKATQIPANYIKQNENNCNTCINNPNFLESFNSTQVLAQDKKQEQNIQMMMNDFKIRFATFLKNINSKITNQQAVKNNLQINNNPLRKVIKNNVKLSTFMSTQNSPSSAYVNKELQKHLYEVSSTKDLTTSYQKFKKSLLEEQSQKYFPSLNKLKEYSNNSRQHSKEKDIQTNL